MPSLCFCTECRLEMRRTSRRRALWRALGWCAFYLLICAAIVCALIYVAETAPTLQ